MGSENHMLRREAEFALPTIPVELLRPAAMTFGGRRVDRGTREGHIEN